MFNTQWRTDENTSNCNLKMRHDTLSKAKEFSLKSIILLYDNQSLKTYYNVFCEKISWFKKVYFFKHNCWLKYHIEDIIMPQWKPPKRCQIIKTYVKVVLLSWKHVRYKVGVPVRNSLSIVCKHSFRQIFYADTFTNQNTGNNSNRIYKLKLFKYVNFQTLLNISYTISSRTEHK